MADFTQVAALLLGCLGMASNMILLLALWRTKAKWNRLNLQSVGPVLLIDTVASFLVVVKEILSFYMGNIELLSTSWLCPYFGTTFIILSCLSMILISAMAIDRYCILVHGFNIRCLWGWLVIVLLGVTVSSLLVLNTVINGLRPNSSFTYCRPDGSNALTLAAHRLATAVVLVGLVVVSFCYARIYLHCRKALAAFHEMSGRFLFVLVAYHICLLPKFITSLWGLFADQSTIPFFIHVIGPLGIVLLFVINPLLVIGLKATLRKELHSLFKHTPS
ncbi:hypothetical protein DSO57_1032285 [Entomophthora muscae]|uniref:Uncharacterized protein n=1 Tax=Entomophthora muscae TaxID=34485 RepID=A0ACC2TBI3_9FUNG|nr:hypothetical protein DSO57_1032285 [Entomophthora muscae]